MCPKSSGNGRDQSLHSRTYKNAGPRATIQRHFNISSGFRQVKSFQLYKVEKYVLIFYLTFSLSVAYVYIQMHYIITIVMREKGNSANNQQEKKIKITTKSHFDPLVPFQKNSIYTYTNNTYYSDILYIYMYIVHLYMFRIENGFQMVETWSNENIAAATSTTSL